ncbi:MAG TPA: BspA family leucine-rich repeat surface protein [Ligilactobacillus salivarius]|uniref:BspA family leucine-rich repeat surface protein n=1 Tax=Ligilactobacillus salivarius TaxID=1624 RepID=A0A921IBG7_9LACO|nr:BspA family leucine-rich repeat surface protein [Ligilactobacillus salivarius]
MHEQKNVYSLRKLSVGLASVIVGTCFFISTNRQNVQADTLNVSERQASTVIQQDSSKKQEQDSNEQNDQTNVSNSKNEQQQSTPFAKDVENVDSNLNDTNKLDNADDSVKVKNVVDQNAVKIVESEANQKFDQVKDQFKQETTKTKNVTSSVIEENDEGKTIHKADVSAKATTLNVAKIFKNLVNVKDITESKVVNKNLNGGFDEATWGTLDVNNWKGNVQGDYYQLTDYTGDANHVIVPNEADFAKAGISTSGKQVGVTSDLMHTIFRDKTTAQDATVAFSKTDNKQVKAIGTDWRNTWGHDTAYINGSWISSKGTLTKFDGTNLDVANVTNMRFMFNGNQISDLNPLANWNVNNVTDMSYMFFGNQISDLNPLANWNVNNVTAMNWMFAYNKISDLSPLANWKVDHVTTMRYMFYTNQIGDLSPLAGWNVNNVTDMSGMFDRNHISDLSPLASWNVNNVTDMSGMFDNNVTAQTKNLPAKRVINFAYPDGYTGKKQDLVTQTVDVPQRVKVELITKDSKPSNNILDWVTKTETPISTLTDPVYFQAYTVPTVSNLVPNISTVAKQEADPNMPLNVVVTYTASPVTVHFVDVDENADKDSDAVKQELDKTIQLSGNYGSEVDLNNVKLPANFELANDLPSVQYGKIDSVTINLKHYINDVKAENAEDATRTIVINKYDGHGNLTSTQTVVQQIAFYKHDYVDAVTNNVKSSKYIFDDKSSPALSHNLVDGKATNDPSYTLKDGKYYFAKYKLDVPAGYKAEEKKINPNMMMISLFVLPTTSTDLNTSQTDTNKKPDTSSSSVIIKPSDSKASHNDSKKQNDQPITSNKETDHTINVSAQAVDPTVEPEKNNVASQNNSTTSAQTQQSSTNDAEQVKNTSIDVPSREENNASKGSNSSSNRSKPNSGKIIHVNSKTPQNGLNEPSKSVSNNSQLPQTGENDGYQYTALSLLLGLNVAIAAVGAEKKRKKY